MLETLGSTLGLARTTQVALCGFFFEQVAFGFVGGDAMRLWLLHRLDIPVRRALEAATRRAVFWVSSSAR